MRIWGRQYSEDGTYQWVAVTTQANSLNDACYVTALAQYLRLNMGESPLYANAGIPQIQTIATQTIPDFYMYRAQQQYAQYFASLTITRTPGTIPPQYNVRAVTHSGAIISQNIPT